MNRYYEKISDFLGSTLVIGVFGLWLIIHTLYQMEYLAFISELAILFGMLILRAESSQAQRLERLLKQDVNNTKKVLEKL